MNSAYAWYAQAQLAQQLSVHYILQYGKPDGDCDGGGKAALANVIDVFEREDLGFLMRSLCAPPVCATGGRQFLLVSGELL